MTAVQLRKFDSHPNQIAVSKTSFVVDGRFFLDFSRPIEVRRRLGYAVGILAPVVHEGEPRGGYVISVERGDPDFATVRALWKARYPSTPMRPTTLADGLEIAADFGAQFPNDC